MPRYTIQEKISVVRNLHLTDQQIGSIVGRSEASVREFRRHTLGIKKDDGFPPGRPPWNAGKKLNPDDYPTMNLFRKGNPAPNKYSLGTIFTQKRLDHYRTYIVTEENKRYPYQQYLYEQYHQVKVPKGSIVLFIDRNTQNFSIDNLKAVTRAEQISLFRDGRKTNQTRKEKLLQIKKALKEYGIKGNQTF